MRRKQDNVVLFPSSNKISERCKLIRNDGVDGKEHVRESYVSEWPRPSHSIIHISDTHVTAANTGLYGSTVYSDIYLRLLLDKLVASQMKPDAIVFTGDIADLGEAEAYLKVKALVEPAAKALGCEVIWVMGNHDLRDEFRVNLLGEAPSTETFDRVYDLRGLRVVVLDSTVHGAHWGEITRSQHNWLKEVLTVPSEHGTILAMHHPPIPSVVDLAITVELTGQRELALTLAGSDVRSIIAGHLHYSTNAMFAGIPVSVASATCYTQDLNIPQGSLQARDGGQSFNLVHVFEEQVVHSVVPLGNYPIMKTRTTWQASEDLKNSGFAGFRESSQG
jgi:3',5'-cyclic-AMP phosphodiesterase